MMPASDEFGTAIDQPQHANMHTHTMDQSSFVILMAFIFQVDLSRTKPIIYPNASSFCIIFRIGLIWFSVVFKIGLCQTVLFLQSVRSFSSSTQRNVRNQITIIIINTNIIHCHLTQIHCNKNQFQRILINLNVFNEWNFNEFYLLVRNCILDNIFLSDFVVLFYFFLTLKRLNMNSIDITTISNYLHFIGKFCRKFENKIYLFIWEKRSTV